MGFSKIKNIDFLKEYTDWNNPGSYSGSNSFFRALKMKYKNVKYKDVKEWLNSQDTYTLHKPKIKNFKRMKTIVPGPKHTIQIDLCDMRAISDENDGYAYLLTAIDVFSKKGWGYAIKNKKGSTVLNELKKIIEDHKPERIHADQGNEFFNKECKDYLKKLDIEMYFTKSELKATIVERFNRTIKEKMWRYFEEQDHYRYIDIIDDLIDSYNNTYHRSIKTTPNKVSDKNINKIYFNLYGYHKNEDIVKGPIDLQFKLDDYVRISKHKRLFEKGYTNNWRTEIFQIDKILFKDPVVFILKDLNKEIIEGKFYKEEIQKIYISKFKTYKIDQIIKSRKIKNKKEYLVSWKGYPASFNSWIKEEDIE